MLLPEQLAALVTAESAFHLGEVEVLGFDRERTSWVLVLAPATYVGLPPEEG